MAPKMRHSKMKRLLQEHQAGDHNDRERMQEIYDCQNLYTSVTKAEGSESRTSQCNNVNVFQHQKKRLRSDEGNVTAIEKECVFSNPNSNVFATGQATYTVGQAVYQRSRQVSTMTMKIQAIIFIHAPTVTHLFGLERRLNDHHQMNLLFIQIVARKAKSDLKSQNQHLLFLKNYWIQIMV